MVLKRSTAEKILRRYAPRRTKRGDAFLDRVRRTLNTDEAQFEWMLRLLDIDIDHLSVAGVTDLYREVWFILDRGKGRSFADGKFTIRPTEYEIWKRVQQDVGAFLRNLAEDNFHVYKIETLGGPTAVNPNGGPLSKEGGKVFEPTVVNPDTAWQLGEMWEWAFFRTGGRLTRRFYGTLPTQALLASADLLDRLGPHRLKVCPLLANDKICGRLFLARRAQKYCSRQHAARAAWQRWLQKHHGGTRAKRDVS